MTRSNKLLTFLFSLFTFAFLAAVSPIKADAAARLYFDPAAATVNKDQEFEVKVQIDVESESAFGADAILVFTSSDLSVVSITNGGFFPDFAQAAITDQIELHGYFSSVFDSKSGAGTLATVKFKSLKDTGTSAVTFACGAGNDTQILDTDGDNILACGSLNQSNITFSTTTQVDQDTSQPTPTPNSCGGTCGSNANCKADLYCYLTQGFCRNPACPTDTDCSCNVTVTPAKAKLPTKAKATIKPSPTPQKVALVPYEKPTPAPEETPLPSEELRPGLLADRATIAIVVVVLAIVAGFFIVRRFLAKRKRPPESTPPTEGGESEVKTESVKPPVTS
ncbi:hypothetical protein HYT59_02600 [Candidatus Woesebacteria bacterium]|nr:hypothetical protein [Candidatus Woesebacteria bacterium]